jgi:hypothetical protein
MRIAHQNKYHKIYNIEFNNGKELHVQILDNGFFISSKHIDGQFLLESNDDKFVDHNDFNSTEQLLEYIITTFHNLENN